MMRTPTLAAWMLAGALGPAASCSRGRTQERAEAPAGEASATPRTGDTANGLRELARATCAGAGVTAVWWAAPVPSGIATARGFARLDLVPDRGASLTWIATERGATMAHDVPEVVFSPDCARVALLEDRHGPYVVVATADLLAHARGARVPARYLDDQVPCALGFVYSDLRWRSPTEVEYRSGGEPFEWRRVDVTRAPDRLVPKPCLDPHSPLHEGAPRR